jgi:hypothetical protein
MDNRIDAAVVLVTAHVDDYDVETISAANFPQGRRLGELPVGMPVTSFDFIPDRTGKSDYRPVLRLGKISAVANVGVQSDLAEVPFAMGLNLIDYTRTGDGAPVFYCPLANTTDAIGRVGPVRSCVLVGIQCSLHSATDPVRLTSVLYVREILESMGFKSM